MPDCFDVIMPYGEKLIAVEHGKEGGEHGNSAYRF